MEGTMSQSYWENSRHPLSCTLFPIWKLRLQWPILMPSPLLPTILPNQSQYTCCLTCLPFPSFSPLVLLKGLPFLPGSHNQSLSNILTYFQILCLWLSVTVIQTLLIHSPSPMESLPQMGPLPFISTATLQFWATTMRLHACSSFPNGFLSPAMSLSCAFPAAAWLVGYLIITISLLKVTYGNCPDL